VQDPTHCNPCNESTWEYFDPNWYLYGIYKPKPFHVEHRSWQAEGNMEVLLKKITEEEGEKRHKATIEKYFGKSPEEIKKESELQIKNDSEVKV
jgi:DUF2075 family protein